MRRTVQMLPIWILCVLAASWLLACGANGGGEDGDSNDTNIADGDNPADGDADTGLKIYDLQNTASSKHPAIATRVTLQNVIATSDVLAVASNMKGVFLADQGGGPYSGILLTWKPTSADATYGYDPPAITKGMIITVAGNYNEFCGTKTPYYTHCSSQVELTPFKADKGEVTDTGSTGTVPAAVTVDADKVKTDGAEADKWEDVLVQVDNVTVLTAPTAANYGTFTVTGNLDVDDQFYKYSYADVTVGKVYDRLRGFLYTSYDTTKLTPRDASDMIGQGQLDGDEDGDTTVDGDNPTDGDNTSEASSELKISDIQDTTSAKHPAVGDRVVLNNVILASDPFTVSYNTTAQTASLMGAFLSDQQGGPYTGILLTWKPVAYSAQYGYDPPTMSKGMIVNVEGNTSEFCGTATPAYTHCSTQVELTQYQKDKGTVTLTGSTGTPPDAITVDPAKVKTDGEDSEKYQDVLIQVANVSVLSAPSSATHGNFSVTGGLVVDDQLFKYDYTTVTVGKNYSLVRGFLYTNFDIYQVLPRDANDLVDQGASTDGDVDSDQDADSASDSDSQSSSEEPTVTVKQIQNVDAAGHPAASSRVLLGSAVATSSIFTVSGSLKGFFVSDVTGGAFSGVLVVYYAGTTGGYTPPTFTVGDLLSVEGRYDEYCPSGSSVCMTELNVSPSGGTTGVIAKLNQTAIPPEAQVVEPNLVSTTGTDREKWQGSLVTVDGVTIQTAPDTYGAFTVTGGLGVDDVIYAYTASTMTVGKVFSSLTGFLYTSYGAFKLLPRSAADMVADSGSDSDSDSDSQAASDTDSDSDSQAPELTIHDLRTTVDSGTTTLTYKDKVVDVPNVVVTSPVFVLSSSSHLSAVFASDLNGGAHTGIVVLWTNTTYTAPTLAVGDKIDLTGKFTLYGTTTTTYELDVTAGAITKLNVSANTPAPFEGTAASFLLASGANAAPYQSSLIKITDALTVSTAPSATGLFAVNSGNFKVGSYLYTYTTSSITVGLVYSSMTGILYITSGVSEILPRSADDMPVQTVVTDGDADSDSQASSDSDTTVDGDQDTSPAEVMINEFAFDGGSDSDYPTAIEEWSSFIELKGPAGKSLTGYTVQLINGGVATTNATYIYGTLSLDGQTIPASGYFVIVSSRALNPVITAAATMTWASAPEFQNGTDSIRLMNGTTVVDTVGYSGTSGAYAVYEGSPIPDSPQSNVKSLCRYPDGGDTNNNATDFNVNCNMTPGAANTLYTSSPANPPTWRRR